MKQLNFTLQGETYLVNDIHAKRVKGRNTGYVISSYNRHTLNRLKDRCSEDAVLRESIYEEDLYILTSTTLDPHIITKVDRHVSLVGEMAIECNEPQSMDFGQHSFY